MSKLSKEKLCIKSPSKINLHLEVIGKRDDGYHELAMIMQSLDLADFLEFEINREGLIKLNSDSINLSLSDDNLIIKSANILRKVSNKNLGANIFLRKNIPVGAGLAGGSSNAAATLIGLNKLWDLKLDYNTIFELSKSLGSDVPFFINGGCQLCFGRGEILENIHQNLDYGVLLVKNPNVSISTPETYKKYSLKYSHKYDVRNNVVENIRNDLRENGINRLGVENKSINIQNDLQRVVEKEDSSVKTALDLLSNLEDSLTFSMSGSGPTCYALFKNVHYANRALEHNYKIFKNKGFDLWVCKFINKGIEFI